MRVERRIGKDPTTNKSKTRGMVLIAENDIESKLLDDVFGSDLIDEDGLIGIRKAECRVADGYGEHYVYINALEAL